MHNTLNVLCNSEEFRFAFDVKDSPYPLLRLNLTSQHGIPHGTLKSATERTATLTTLIAQWPNPSHVVAVSCVLVCYAPWVSLLCAASSISPESNPPMVPSRAQQWLQTPNCVPISAGRVTLVLLFLKSKRG